MIRTDLDAVLADIWQRLTDGAKNRHSALHTPVIASVDPRGAPHQRVMVLREASAEKCHLRFHTDVRTPKVDQLAENEAVSVIGYDAAAKIQIRVGGIGRIERVTDAADKAWESSAPSSKRCYLAEVAPGAQSDVPTSGLPEQFQNRVPSVEETLPARTNFSVLTVEARTLEWLYLASDGHRRAMFDQTETGWRGQWLIP